MEKVRGVNLGNWLVLEKWMSPQIFEGTEANDEIWLNRDLDRDTLERRMRHHRDTYITAEDFAIIAAQGINKLRIPVPYFIFGDRAPLSGCIEYLDKAFDWAEGYGMQILVDLHTVPGGQNGRLVCCPGLKSSALHDNNQIVGDFPFRNRPWNLLIPVCRIQNMKILRG